MSPRIIDLPSVGFHRLTILNGPQVEGASQEMLDGKTQGVSSPYGSWIIRLSFVPTRDADARELRGWIKSLHNGANFTRVPLYDIDRPEAEPYLGADDVNIKAIIDSAQNEPDVVAFISICDAVIIRDNNGPQTGLFDITFDHEGTEAGIVAGDEAGVAVFHSLAYEVLIRDQDDAVLGDGYFAGGESFIPEPKHIPVTATSAIGDNEVDLEYSGWVIGIDVGSRFGFGPFHLGMYEVTEVIGDGQFRIWPPLRKAIDTADFATIEPVLMMKLITGEEPALSRDNDVARDINVTLIEVQEDDARDFAS